jgi:hypothetical protein
MDDEEVDESPAAAAAASFGDSDGNHRVIPRMSSNGGGCFSLFKDIGGICWHLLLRSFCGFGFLQSSF